MKLLTLAILLAGFSICTLSAADIAISRTEATGKIHGFTCPCRYRINSI